MQFPFQQLLWLAGAQQKWEDGEDVCCAYKCTSWLIAESECQNHDMIIAPVNSALHVCVFRCCSSLINVYVRLELHGTSGDVLICLHIHWCVCLCVWEEVSCGWGKGLLYLIVRFYGEKSRKRYGERERDVCHAFFGRGRLPKVKGSRILRPLLFMDTATGLNLGPEWIFDWFAFVFKLTVQLKMIPFVYPNLWVL